MRDKKILIFIGLIIFSLPVLCANAAVLDFEDLPGSGDLPLPVNYAGFEWGGFYGWPQYVTDGTMGYGWANGTIGDVALRQGGALPSGESNIFMKHINKFNIYGAYITAGWYDNQDVFLEGWRDGSIIYTKNLLTSTDKAYWFDINFDTIDTFWIKTGSGGTSVVGSVWWFVWHSVAIDNITYSYSSAPLPGTVMLFGSGLLGLAFRRKTRKS